MQPIVINITVLDANVCAAMSGQGNLPRMPMEVEACVTEQQLFDAIVSLQAAVTPAVRDMLAEHEAEQQV